MFVPGRIFEAAADGRTACVCEIRRADELWGIIYGPTQEEAQRRARLAARALNRERALN
ncbi:MAG TPA: hypothetical protein VEQ62_17970 [Stellaceae bacterium]|jgi:hypothetical protein|nr:hypothetical protein [Stellaceae bacterium]